jgi:hypothetical protein
MRSASGRIVVALEVDSRVLAWLASLGRLADRDATSRAKIGQALTRMLADSAAE